MGKFQLEKILTPVCLVPPKGTLEATPTIPIAAAAKLQPLF